MSFPFIIKMI